MPSVSLHLSGSEGNGCSENDGLSEHLKNCDGQMAEHTIVSLHVRVTEAEYRRVDKAAPGNAAMNAHDLIIQALNLRQRFPMLADTLAPKEEADAPE